MASIGFIGSGHVGQAIARRAIAAGHTVVMSNSRGPETLAGLVAAFGPRASAATATAASNAAEIVIVVRGWRVGADSAFGSGRRGRPIRRAG